MKKITQSMLDEMVRRILLATQPKRIILFGSVARGEWGPNSDIDVLVIVPDGMHRRKTAQSIYQRLLGFPVATDVIVATQHDLVAGAEDMSLVYHDAMRDGRELYHAA